MNLYSTGYIDIHTHKIYADDTLSIFNAHLFQANDKAGKQSIGLHPWYIKDIAKEMFQLRKQIAASDIVAIGECGLDKMTSTPYPIQEEAFKLQIQLAKENNLPIIVHCVKAYQECEMLLQNYDKVIFHGFNKKLNFLLPLLFKGYYISFGTSLLQASTSIVESFLNTPIEQLFLETDHKPNHIKEVYKAAAKLRGISEESLIIQIQKNYNKLFN